MPSISHWSAFAFSTVLVAGWAQAQDTAGLPDTQKLSEALGGVEPDTVAETPMQGVYEVLVDGKVFYLSDDGRFVMQGDLVDLERQVNLTSERQTGLRKSAIDSVPLEDQIIFSPEGEVKHYVSVFTDIDCGYCRKLHQEMQTYLDKGIEVRYLSFPRAGMGSESHRKAEAVWCSADPQTAMTEAKAGQAVPYQACDNPVEREFELGRKLGITGTPAIILDDGSLIPGYLTADRLQAALEAAKQP